MSAASDIQQAREAADLANHMERLEWLTQEAPRWACGALVDTYTKNALLLQSRVYVAKATGSAK